MANSRLKALHDAGVSIWLDDLSRDMINSGTLADRISESSVVGVTTNPTIFAKALATGDAYAAQLAELSGSSVDEVVRALTTRDVASACDAFAPLAQATSGYDGRVSIEVDPGLAHDTEGTVNQAKLLHKLVAKDNVLIKIPATKAGLPAITETIAAGISVNVTLIFSLDRYREVINAYLDGLEQAQASGIDLSTLHSVASFFVSRVDSEVDKRLEAIGSPEALALRGRTAIANAQLAYALFEETIAGSRWEALARAGANRQRPLWASTGVKNPDYPDTMYVSELVGDGVVNTMPGATMDAWADHGELTGTPLGGPAVAAEATKVMEAVAAVGVDMDDVVQQLEDEGVEKFVDSWRELLATVKNQLEN
ncbi:transaldolase [Parenemella sanctibonifatiensis]|uniref:Transaldolase n=1 Tax=Parenemella sanctibonifatiensis TaxID=2016505 RepID=A0A255E9P6_9ACTN|nr:transaldolase [Parenemella sanctibonifatiensis]OYN88294.1 transaldolase [Parenemella sanctibonifatiensis]